MIESIFISPDHGGKQQAVAEVELIVGSGIVGDRNYGKAKWPGQNITFIEIEEIENFNQKFGQSISIEATRRNVVTKGVRLNSLLGKEFSVGGVKFRGVELCEPCATLGELLENETISKKYVVKAFVGKGGLRVDILSNGTLAVGMEFLIHENA